MGLAVLLVRGGVVECNHEREEEREGGVPHEFSQRSLAYITIQAAPGFMPASKPMIQLSSLSSLKQTAFAPDSSALGLYVRTAPALFSF